MRPVRPRVRMALVAALTCLWAAPLAAAPSLEALMARLAPADGRLASDYTQTRESSLLAQPVRTRGRIVYESPGRLRKTETTPDGERVIIIRRGTVEIRGPEETRSFPLSRARPLEQLMRLLEALATGDADALRRHFDVQLEGDRGWTLVLEAPHDRRSRSGPHRIHDDPLRITVTGRADAIERIVIEPPQGQRTVLEIGTGS